MTNWATISLPTGTVEGETVYGYVSSNRPISKGFLRRLAKHLEFIAQEWEDLARDAASPPPPPEEETPTDA